MAKPPRNPHLTTPFLLALLVLTTFVFTNAEDLIYNGFKGARLHIDGSTNNHSNGLLQLTNLTFQQMGHAFHPSPLKFNTTSLSFSTTFAFAMYPQVPAISGHGIAFVITPSTDFTKATPGQYLGFFNSSTNNITTSHIFSVEMDTIQNLEFGDIDSNHVGVDVNSLTSIAAASATYYSDKEMKNVSLNLISGEAMQIWIDYDDEEKRIDITIAPLKQPKPSKVLLTTHLNLSSVLLGSMYVGFSSATGSVASNHYVLGWSFSQGKQAQSLDYSKLPKLPKVGGKKKMSPGSIALLVILLSLFIVIVGAGYVARKKKYEELVEDWEEAYITQRVSYKDLYKATKGFKNTEVLGEGGFGKVYKGILPSTNIDVAVKRVSHESGRGMQEFVAEIACMSRVRHRNLVRLLGYSRRKKELLLVYDYMPNGSLDKYLFTDERPTLSWNQRFNIIKGVSSALLYLHEGWEQVVLHRDIKSSNVLLDNDMNSCLGDFGLAKLHDHGTNPRTTHVVGTVGYLAPEMARKGKATTGSDVYAFGTFLLEVTCGRRPVRLHGANDQEILVDWVHECWKRGVVLEVCDPRLGREYEAEEVELVLKLGLICTHYRAEVRPSMRQVNQFLNRDASLPEVLLGTAGPYMFTSSSSQTTSSFPQFSSSSSTRNFDSASLYNTTDSVLQHGR